MHGFGGLAFSSIILKENKKIPQQNPNKTPQAIPAENEELTPFYVD